LTLGTDRAKIKRFIDGIEDSARAVIKEVTTLSVWGGINPDSVWMMTYQEREVLSEVIKDRTEAMYGKKGFARSHF
jgi:hypothetical protein